MTTEERPFKTAPIKITCNPTASLFPLSAPSCFYVKVSVPVTDLSFHKSISSLNPPIHLAFSFSFALLLMQIPWLILHNCHFSIWTRWKKIIGNSAFIDKVKHRAARKALMDQRLKHNLSSPLPSHLAISLLAHLSFLFMSALKNDFSSIFKVAAFPHKAKMPYASLSNTLWLQCPLPSHLNCIYVNSSQLDPSFRAARQGISNNACIFPNTAFLIHHECNGGAENQQWRRKKKNIL